MKIQLVPTKKVAPNFMPYVSTGLYVAIAAFVIVGIIMKEPLFIVPCFVCALALFIISRCFAWYVSAELKVFGDSLMYSVIIPMNMLGHDKSVYTIKHIDRYVVKRNVVTVYGRIIDKEPLQKSKEIKKVQIYDYNDKVIAMLDKFISDGKSKEDTK